MLSPCLWNQLPASFHQCYPNLVSFTLLSMPVYIFHYHHINCPLLLLLFYTSDLKPDFPQILPPQTAGIQPTYHTIDTVLGFSRLVSCFSYLLLSLSFCQFHWL